MDPYVPPDLPARRSNDTAARFVPHGAVAVPPRRSGPAGLVKRPATVVGALLVALALAGTAAAVTHRSSAGSGAAVDTATDTDPDLLDATSTSSSAAETPTTSTTMPATSTTGPRTTTSHVPATMVPRTTVPVTTARPPTVRSTTPASPLTTPPATANQSAGPADLRARALAVATYRRGLTPDETACAQGLIDALSDADLAAAYDEVLHIGKITTATGNAFALGLAICLKESRIRALLERYDILAGGMAEEQRVCISTFWAAIPDQQRVDIWYDAATSIAAPVDLEAQCLGGPATLEPLVRSAWPAALASQLGLPADEVPCADPFLARYDDSQLLDVYREVIVRGGQATSALALRFTAEIDSCRRQAITDGIVERLRAANHLVPPALAACIGEFNRSLSSEDIMRTWTDKAFAADLDRVLHDRCFA